MFFENHSVHVNPIDPSITNQSDVKNDVNLSGRFIGQIKYGRLGGRSIELISTVS